MTPALPTPTALAPPRQGHGFTMVELMVTLAVAVILGMVALPSFQGIIAAQKIRNGASDLYMALVKARSEAIKRNGNVVLAPTGGDWENGWQITEQSSGNVLDSHGSLSGIALTGPANVTYQGSGRVMGAAGAFSFSSPQVATATPRCITVDLSGRPSVKAATC